MPRWDLDFKIGGNIFGDVFLDAHTIVKLEHELKKMQFELIGGKTSFDFAPSPTPNTS